MSRDANDIKLDVSPTFRRAIELWCRMYLWQADPLLRITTWLVRKSTVIRKFDHCLTVLNNNLINRFSLYLSIRIYIFIVFFLSSSSDIFWFTFLPITIFDRYVLCTMISYKQTSSVLPFVFSISLFFLSLYLYSTTLLLLLLLLICLSTHVSLCLHFV